MSKVLSFSHEEIVRQERIDWKKDGGERRLGRSQSGPKFKLSEDVVLVCNAVLTTESNQRLCSLM